MEERYQVAARRDIQNLLQISSSPLKFLISRSVAVFQGECHLGAPHSLRVPTVMDNLEKMEHF